MATKRHIAYIGGVSALAFGVVIIFSRVAHAQTQFQYVPLATLPAGNGGTYLTQQGVATTPLAYISNLYTFAVSIGIVIAVVTGVWAGVEWMMSGDSSSKKNSAIHKVQNVGWGFALLLCSYVILDIVNPQLVSFNLNLGTYSTAQTQEDIATQQATLNSLVSQNAAATVTAQIANQNAQQNVNNIQDQINLCQSDQQDGEMSATELTQAGCDDAGLASLQSQLKTAQANLQQTQTALAQATSAQNSEAQNAIASAQSTVTSIQNQISQLNPNDPNYANQKSNLQSELSVAQANLGYQQFQQNYVNSIDQVAASLANGDISSLQTLRNSINGELGTISSTANTDANINNTGLQSTLQSEHSALNVQNDDLVSIQDNINSIQKTAQNMISSIQTSIPTTGMSPSAFEQSLLSQYSQTALTNNLSSSDTINTPALQNAQQAYINQQNTNIQNAVLAQCQAKFGKTNSGCTSSGASGSW